MTNEHSSFTIQHSAFTWPAGRNPGRRFFCFCENTHVVIPITTTRFEVPLGVWTCSECRPPGLAGAVESIWEVEGVVVNPRERIFPNPHVDIVLNLGAPQRIVEGFDAYGAFVEGTACVSGLQQQPLIVESGLATHVFGIRLHAAAAQALLATDMSALSGRVVELPDVVRHSSVIVERFRAAGSF